MKHLGIFIFFVVLTSCSRSDDQTIHYLIGEYQGRWYNPVYANDELFMEHLIITGNNMEYVLENTNTNVIYDKQVGTFVTGNENKIGWNCISLISNMQNLTTWNVLSLSENQMSLYSNQFGEHNYQKDNIFNKSDISDTLMAMFQFKKSLPLLKKDVVKKYGTYNRIISNSSISYLLNHPLFSKVEFKENYENDSIYTYALLVKDWISSKQIVDSQYTIIRYVNGRTEYCDAVSLDKSSNIIITDSANNQLTFSPIRDYDYWPNVSHFMGTSIEDVKKEYKNKYVYEYNHSNEDDLNEYQFYTKHDGICEYLGVASDSEGIVRRSWVTILGKYSEEQKKMILHLLENKYQYRKEDNDTYYYSGSSNGNSPFEIKYEVTKKRISFINKSQY